MKTEILDILNQQNGIKPELWGPYFWKTLFYTGLNYPVKIDKNNKCHITLRKHYKVFFCSLQYTLPCIFCLESYRRFWKEDEIDRYLDSRMNLLKWLYMLKDKVNKKLIYQEKQRFQSEKKKLLDKYKEKYGSTNLWKKTVNIGYSIKLDKLEKKIIKTKNSPTINQAMEYFASLRV
jgi:hypothetical protein